MSERICTVCDRQLGPSDASIRIEGDYRVLTFCRVCAEANTQEPDVLISVPELLEQFDHPKPKATTSPVFFRAPRKVGKRWKSFPIGDWFE